MEKKASSINSRFTINTALILQCAYFCNITYSKIQEIFCIKKKIQSLIGAESPAQLTAPLQNTLSNNEFFHASISEAGPRTPASSNANKEGHCLLLKIVFRAVTSDFFSSFYAQTIISLSVRGQREMRRLLLAELYEGRRTACYL